MNTSNTHHQAADDSDLMALWQSDRAAPDPELLIASVQASVQLQRRFLWATHAFGLLVLVYVAWLDFKGVFQWPGLMSLAVGGSMVYSAVKAYIVRRRCPDLALLSPLQLLKLALRHARAGLRNARMCHTGVPLSVGLGVVIGPWLIVDGADGGEPGWVGLLWVLTALGCVLGFIIYGIRLARRKKIEIAELEQRLREFDADL